MSPSRAIISDLDQVSHPIFSKWNDSAQIERSALWKGWIDTYRPVIMLKFNPTTNEKLLKKLILHQQAAAEATAMRRML